MEAKRCCGTCKWHCRNGIDGDFVCDNSDSECYTDWTEYEDSCPEWEGR